MRLDHHYFHYLWPHAGRDSADSRLRESRSKLGERARLGFDKRARSSRHQKISGGDSGGATPDPISNSEVKSSRADGTAGETLWESRSPPGLFSLIWEPSEGSHIPSLDGARPAQPAGSPCDYGRKASPSCLFLGGELPLLVGPTSQASQFAPKVLGDEMLQAVVRPVQAAPLAVDLAARLLAFFQLAQVLRQPG